MADEAAVIPAKEVPARWRGLYVAVRVLFGLCALATAGYVGVLTAAPKVKQAEAEADRAKAEADKAKMELAREREIQQSRAEVASATASKAKKEDEATAERLRQELREAKEKADKAEIDRRTAESAKRAQDAVAARLERENEEQKRQSGVLANQVEKYQELENKYTQLSKELEKTRSDLRKANARIEELTGVQQPKVPESQPERPLIPTLVLKAGGSAVVKRVISGGAVLKSVDGGREFADEHHKFREGEAVRVKEVTKTGIKIASTSGERTGWLTVSEAELFLQPTSEK